MAHAADPEVPAAHSVETAPATGALFYPSVLGAVPKLGGPHFCSAGVVDSPSRDLLVTAAHCVFGTGATIEFAPLLHDSELPGGVWSVTDMYIDPAWKKSFDPRHDVAFLRVAPHGGKKIEDVVPGLPLGTPRAQETVTVSGYPMGSRGRPLTCDAPLEQGDGYSGIHCTGFGSGTSGGPWVQNDQVVGVIGGREQGGCAPDVEYSTPFGDDVRSLLERATAGGTGDLVPIGFTANAC
ncbi:trypsin-like serine protease [Streptomyces sp. SID14478]|uniref:trypsin-like peptidase domain-containing protein n=1 Tax=Streptomyces sp. SID14478 TaxID=2706073 RepID=UPI0013D9C43F|nr:trypsin-like serine protease [Streptomyces sp. SID14478]